MSQQLRPHLALLRRTSAPFRTWVLVTLTVLGSVTESMGSQFTCITAPEVTEGPYYINNELVRQDLTETQTYVPAFSDGSSFTHIVP